MRIAIDARKWRDYGIGTYIRNLVRHMARLDRSTEYVLIVQPADVEIAVALDVSTLVPVLGDEAFYPC